MIEARRQQLHFGDGLITEEVSDLPEEWMQHADQVLEDEKSDTPRGARGLMSWAVSKTAGPWV